MKQIKLIIKTKTQKYPIIIGSNLIGKASQLIKKNSINFNKCLIVVDKNVPKKMVNNLKKSLYKKKLFLHYLNATEKNKNQKTTNKILDFLLNKNFSRNDCVISLGGGITGDITGFAASLFKRGLKFINIPTTFLSQVDSSIGGKTGVNTALGKNLIGSFYQPKLVISDSNFLKTLPNREIICGYGEVLKHALILDKNLFKFLNKNFSKIFNLKSPYIEAAIFKSCKIKKKVVEKDEKEKKLRKILNFGHTFAHAFEATLKYSNKLNHGEAVLLGMITALKFSLKNNFLNKKEYFSILNHYEESKLPSNIRNYFSKRDLKKILFYMLKDKKNNSDLINLILLRKIGTTLIDKKFNKKKINLFLKSELSN